jgi:hypothetical protein
MNWRFLTQNAIQEPYPLENKYGCHTAATKPITIMYLIKFHGHFCGVTRGE